MVKAWTLFDGFIVVGCLLKYTCLDRVIRNVYGSWLKCFVKENDDSCAIGVAFMERHMNYNFMIKNEPLKHWGK